MNWLTTLLAIVVSAIRFGQALEFQKLEQAKSALNTWLVIKAVLCVVFFVPILFTGLILIFTPSLNITTIIVIMACTPTTNLSNNLLIKFGTDPALTKRIEFIASLLCIVTTPLLLELMSRMLSVNLDLDFRLIIQQLVISQVVPTGLGVVVQKWWPKSVKHAKSITGYGSMVLLIVFALLVMQNLPSFAFFELRGYVAITFATICAFIMGIIFSDRNQKTQISFAVETSLRNPGLVALIANENLLAAQAKAIVIPYIVTILLTIVVCLYLFRLISSFNGLNRYGEK